MYGVRLRQIVKILRAAPEVLLWVRGIAKSKLPSLVQSDYFTLTLSTRGQYCRPDSHYRQPILYFHIVPQMIQKPIPIPPLMKYPLDGFFLSFSPFRL